MAVQRNVFISLDMSVLWHPVTARPSGQDLGQGNNMADKDYVSI